MKCDRCLSINGKDAECRVRTDVIDLKICRDCAADARALGLKVEPMAKRLRAEKSLRETLIEFKFGRRQVQPTRHRPDHIER